MRGQVIREAERHQLGVYGKLPIVIDRASDVWIFSNDGRKFLDLYGGHAVCVTGHNHSRIVEAVQVQAEHLLFYSNLVYNSSRASAARDLVEAAPESLKKVFFVNSGAEANDNAIKLARMITKRPTVVSFEGGFHGRTIGTLSATGLAGYR